MAKPEAPALKALVVEDQEQFCQAICEELNFLGFETFVAKDGEEGLKAANAQVFDLILSDMRMPNKDGRWFLNQLRLKQIAKPPFVFITGFTELSLQDSYDMGADAFLSKPFDSDRLAEILAKVCRPMATRWSERPKITPTHHITSKDIIGGQSGFNNQVVIGRGGVFLPMATTPLRAGQSISFDIEVKAETMRNLKGTGIIVWRNDSTDTGGNAGYGISFDYLEPTSLTGWLDYLGRRDIVAVIPKGHDSASNGAQDQRATI